MKNKLLIITALTGLLFLSMRNGWESAYTPRLHRELPLSALHLNYPFLNLDQNKIQFPGDSLSFTRIYDLFDQMIYNGNGKITIMHMGGSHVQAGVLENRMRENLFQLAPDIRGQRGFFFPFKMAKTNSPFNIKADFTGEWEGCRNAVNSSFCDWGLSGINATTSDSTARVKIWTFDSDSLNYSFTRVRIYHPTNIPQLCLIPDTDYPLLHQRLDSIGGYTELVYNELCDTLSFRLERTDSTELNFVLQGVKFENDSDYGLSYHAIGVNGASVPSYLRCTDFTRHLSGNRPDLVIFGIGINDAHVPENDFRKENFKQNYKALMSAIRSVNPDVNFLFLTNNDSYYKRRRVNRNGLKVREAMYELCAEEGAGLWDLFEVMGGLNSIRAWQDAGLAKSDKIHLTTSGYELQADLLTAAFVNSMSDYFRAKYPLTVWEKPSQH